MSLQRHGKAMTDFKEHEWSFLKGKGIKNIGLECMRKVLYSSGKKYLQDVITQPIIALRGS